MWSLQRRDQPRSVPDLRALVRAQHRIDVDAGIFVARALDSGSACQFTVAVDVLQAKIAARRINGSSIKAAADALRQGSL